MKIDAQHLATEALRLEIPAGAEATNLLVLGPSGGVTGTYAQDAERIHLDEIAGDELRLTELDWHLPQGRATLDGAALLRGALVDAKIGLRGTRPPFAGRIAAQEARIEAVTAEVGAVRVRIEGLVIGGLDVRIGDDGAAVAELGSLHAERLWVKTGGLEASASGVELSEGLRLDRGAVSLPRMHAHEIDLGIDELASLASKDEGQGEREGAQQPAKEPRDASQGDGGPGVDLRFLDALHGRIHVDLRVDATVPLIGRRRATHRFRIPIEQGALDYHRLERDLATLEDAFIDFAVRGNRLTLERDIPLVPVRGKTLVYWPLDGDGDLELAHRRRVRLRRLASPQVPEPRKNEEVEKGKRGVVLRQLDFDDLDVQLELRQAEMQLAGGTLRLGDDEQPAVEHLGVKGDVRYEPNKPIEHTEVDVEARGLRAGIDGLRVGERRLDIDTIEVTAIEDVRLDLEGVRPSGLAAKVRSLSVSAIALEPDA